MKLTLLLCTATLLPHITQAATRPQPLLPSDGLELLQKISRHYAEAKEYSIELSEERTINSKYFRQWTKTIATAAEEPGGRFHFDGTSEFGGAVEISDGRTIWRYRANQHRYTVRPVLEASASKPSPIGMSESGLMEAKNLRESLASSAKRVKSAERLRDVNLSVNGRKYSCAVVHMGQTDLKRKRPKEKFDETIWIDKSAATILKVVEHSSDIFNGVVQDDVATTIYPHTKLDTPLSSSLFVFSAASDAHQVKEFPSPEEEAFGGRLLGDRVPPLKFKAVDGTITPIESFRGKTVIIDLWATWCAPCVAALPSLAKLAKEAKGKGLVLITVDRDEEASKATAYLKLKGLDLTNFHDGDGKIESMLGASPLPRELIIDQAGWVVVDAQSDENSLRSRLAELDPAFKEFAPKAEVNP